MVSGLGESVDTILPVYDTRAYYCQKQILSEYYYISQIERFMIRKFFSFSGLWDMYHHPPTFLKFSNHRYPSLLQLALPNWKFCILICDLAIKSIKTCFQIMKFGGRDNDPIPPICNTNLLMGSRHVSLP